LPFGYESRSRWTAPQTRTGSNPTPVSIAVTTPSASAVSEREVVGVHVAYCDGELRHRGLGPYAADADP
jgi:hypothetical protein